MNRLWAPWRSTYVTQLIDRRKGCVFCEIARQKRDRKNYIVLRAEYCFAVLNLYPYNNGHTLLLPYRHVKDLQKLKEKESAELYGLIGYIKGLLDETLSPAGYNIGLNLGRIAGAGFPGHLHFHIVPRWKGDANFMPAIGDVRVVSQSLGDVHRRLTEAHKKRKGR